MSSSERTTDVEALTAVLAERAQESAGEDPEAEELLDYLEGRLSPEADREIERRLVASPEATRKLLDLADLAEAGAEAETESGDEPADLAVHAGWRDLQTRLPGGSAARPSRTDRLGPPNRGLVALAATLFVAVLALGAWVWQLERKTASDGGLLVANLQTLELFEAVRSDRLPAVELRPGEPLHLVLAPAERCPAYRAEVAGPGAEDRRTVTGLARDERGLVSLLVPGRPGSYTLRLLGCEPERDISTYSFEIVRPGAVTPRGDGH